MVVCLSTIDISTRAESKSFTRMKEQKNLSNRRRLNMAEHAISMSSQEVLLRSASDLIFRRFPCMRYCRWRWQQQLVTSGKLKSRLELSAVSKIYFFLRLNFFISVEC